MGVFKALRFYNSLSTEQKEFIKEKKTEDTLSLGQWLKFLAKAAAYDEYGDESRKKLKGILIVLWLLLVVAVVLLFIIENGVNYWNLGVILLIVGLLIFYHVSFARLKQLDLTNQLRLFFVPLLNILLHKAGKNAKLSAKLDFSNFLKEKPASDSKDGSRKIKLFQPKFILGKVRLLDMSIMEFGIGDDHRKLTISKRSSSGKTKVKVKHKITHNALIKISFPKANYVLSDTPGGAVIVEQDEVIVVKRKLKVKSTDKESVMNIEDFLVLVDELYKTVKVKPGVTLPEHQKSAGESSEKQDFDNREFDDDMDSGVSFMVWGAYFDETDYMGFENKRHGYYVAGDEEEDSFFDS